MKYLVYLFSKVILASYIFLWPTFAFENDSFNEQDYLNIPPYYQKIWEDFYETNEVTLFNDGSLTPTEAYSPPAAHDNFLPFTEAAYELEENNLDFNEHTSSMVPDYVPRTETPPGSPPPTKIDSEPLGTETTVPRVELFPELWLQILECTYYDEASQRQRRIAYYAGSVSKTLEKLRRGMKSLMITISLPSRMRYYLTAPQNMFLCVNVECSVKFSQLATLTTLTPSLYVLRLANIEGINIPEAQKDGISRLSQLQHLSIRLVDPTWPIARDTNKARLMQLVSLPTLQLLDLNDYTYVPIVQGSRKLNLSNISTLNLDLSNTYSFNLQELVNPGLTNLQRLKLIGLSVRLENVSVLAQLTSLQDLEIRGYDYRNLLQDLPPLNLTSLRLSQREISDPMLPSISKLQNLRLLDFNYADYGSFHPSEVAETVWTSLQLVRNLETLYLPKPYHNSPRNNWQNVWGIPFTESEKAQEASRLESLIGKPGLQVFFHDSRDLPAYFI